MKMIGYVLFNLVLIAQASAYSPLRDIDFSKCKLVGPVDKNAYQCSQGCSSLNCIQKAECDIGAGPIIIELYCKALADKSCPSLTDCANDNSVTYQKPLSGIPGEYESRDNCGNCGAKSTTN